MKRYVNNLHASDEYVRRLEDQLVTTKAFIKFNNLEPDLEKYKQKVQEVNNATKKEKQRRKVLQNDDVQFLHKLKEHSYTWYPFEYHRIILKCYRIL